MWGLFGVASKQRRLHAARFCCCVRACLVPLPLLLLLLLLLLPRRGAPYRYGGATKRGAGGGEGALAFMVSPLRRGGLRGRSPQGPPGPSTPHQGFEGPLCSSFLHCLHGVLNPSTRSLCASAAAEAALAGGQSSPDMPAKPWAAEQEFLHALLLQVLTLQVRMQGLVRQQEQQRQQQQQQQDHEQHQGQQHHEQQQQQRQQQKQGCWGASNPSSSVPVLHLYKKQDGSCVTAAD